MKKHLLINSLFCSILFQSFGQLVTNGLVSNYSFTNGSKTDPITGVTLSGNIPYPTTDRFGNDSSAYYFHGANNAFFDAGESYDSLLSGNTAKFSMSFWLWLENDGANTARIILSKRADNGCNQDERQFYIGVSPANHIRVAIAGTLAASNYLWEEDTITTLVDSTWYHILYTYDFQQNQRKIYIDCIEDSLSLVQLSGSGMNNGMVPGAAHFGIGASLTVTGTVCVQAAIYSGKIDDIRFYNRVLTPTERDSLCNEPSANISASFSSTDTSFCEKQCINFTDLSTNNPTSWQWFFPGADSTSSTLQNPANICYNNYGSFDVTLIACNGNGCDTLILPNFINEYQSPAANIYQWNDTLFSSYGLNYQWYDSSGPIAGANNYYYDLTQPGSYYVIVTDTNGCNAVSNTIVSTFVDEIDINNLIKVFPNPFYTTLQIKANQNTISDLKIKIYDLYGNCVYADVMFKVQSESIYIDLSELNKGVYFITIESESKYFTKRIIKA